MRGLVTQDEATTKRARDLRRDGSRAERKVWELLRSRRIEGTKFRRQHPIGPYFADFACVLRRLVIEIDGDHHAFQVEADTRRTKTMESEGWRVVRFWAQSGRRESGRRLGGDRTRAQGDSSSPSLSPKGERNMTR